MKIPFFLRLPVLWAAGDTPAGSPLNPNHSKPDVIERLRKYYPLLLLVAVAMIYVVVKAE